MPGTRCKGCECTHEGPQGPDFCPIVLTAKQKAVASGDDVINYKCYLDFSTPEAIKSLGTGAKPKQVQGQFIYDKSIMEKDDSSCSAKDSSIEPGKNVNEQGLKSNIQTPSAKNILGAWNKPKLNTLGTEIEGPTKTDGGQYKENKSGGAIGHSEKAGDQSDRANEENRDHTSLGEVTGDPSLLDIDIRLELLEVLEYETIFPIVGPGIYYADKGQIDGKLNEDNNHKMLNYLEYLEKRVDCGEFRDYNIFKKVLAGVQPDVFRKFLKREPTREEADYCIQDYCREMKKHIIETGHISDSEHYKEIDLGQQYVQLRLSSGHLTEEKSEDSLKCYDNDDYSNDISARNLFATRGKKVLVKGRTGSGKTTLVQWLARKWAIGDITADFSILFVLNIRDLTANCKKEYSLYDLLTKKSLYEIGDKQGFPRQWLKHWSHHVGVIIDGLDEIGSYEELKRKQPIRPRDTDDEDNVLEILSMILNRNLLSESKAIYTTRPFLDLYCLHQNSLSVVQILGFTKNAVLQYIQQHHAENAQKIRTALENKPQLLSACSICFYCVQICSILSDISADASHDIKTYTQLTAFILLRLISGRIMKSDLALMETSNKSDANASKTESTDILKWEGN